MRKFVACLLGMLTIGYSSYCQVWLELYNQGVEDYNNYDLPSAQANCEKALAAFEQEVGLEHKNTAAILRQLVLICYESNQIETGIKYAQQEQATLKAIGQQDELIFGTSQYNLGLLYSAASKWQLAEDALGRALDLHTVYLEADDPAVAEVRGSLASVLFFEGKIDEAQRAFEQALAILDAQDTASPEYFNIMYTYSELLIETGKYDKAISSLSQLTDFYGPDDRDTDYASIMVKIAAAQESAGQIADAKSSYLSAIETFQSLGEESAEDNQIALKSLSIILIQEGKINDAISYMENLVGSRESAKDDAYYMALANLGNIYFSNLDFDQSKKKYLAVVDPLQSLATKNQAFYVASAGLALVSLEQGQNQEALNYCDQALSSVGNREALKVALLQARSSALRSLGRFKEAQSSLQEAIALSYPGSRQMLDLKLGLASLYTATHELEKAKSYFEEILPEFKSQKESAGLHYASFLGVYSVYLQENGSFLEAENALNEAIAIKKKLLGEQSESYLSSYESLGRLYLTKGKYSTAKTVFEEVLNAKRTSEHISRASLANTLNNLGVVNKFIGEYSASEQFLREAMDLYLETFGSDHVFSANAANELGLLYLKMGNLRAAEPRFQEALRTFGKTYTKNHVEYASVLENLAALYSMQGKYEQSRKVLEEVLEIDKIVLGSNHPLYAKTLHNLASTLEELEEYEQASRYYEESIRIYQKVFGTDHPSFANTLYNVAVLEQEIGNYEGAKAHYQQVIDIRKKVLNESHPDLAYSVFGLASVKQKLEDWEGAREDYEFVIQSYLNSINSYFPSLSEEEKSAFYAKIKPVFEAYQDFAIEYVVHERGSQELMNKSLGSLYDLQLSTKALLLNATNKVRNRILSSGDQSLINKYNEWVSLKEDLVKALNMSNADLKKNKINLAQLQATSNDAEKELSKISVSFASEYEKKMVTWRDIQSRLGHEEAAMEILRIKKNTKNDSIYYAGLIVKSAALSPELVIVRDGANMESKFFKQYKNLVIYKLENKRSYGQFWQEIDKHLEGISRLYLSSDGVYNKININTLYDPEEGTYTFDKYSIHLLSNTRELVDRQKEHDAATTKKATIFGYPDYEMGGVAQVTEEAIERGFSEGISELPGTLEEINNISATLDQNGWAYDKFQRDQASEQNIKNINNPVLLHVATHGFFMPDKAVTADPNAGLQSREAKFNPLFRSGLLLAGASKTFKHEKLPGDEDGILTAYEAMNLNLDQTELVVMSACETGLGEVKNGEGVYGLQRAFIVAGAENLIMSLWKVNDETTQKLMSRFYSNWIGGLSKQQAFHDAIESLKKEYSEPYYWGAFVMLGL